MAYMIIKCKTPSGVNIRQSATTGSSRLGLVQNGVTVNVTAASPGANDTWYKISWSGIVGWVNSGPGGAWWTIVQNVKKVIARTDKPISKVPISTTNSHLTPLPDPDYDPESDFYSEASKEQEFNDTVNMSADAQSYFNKLYMGYNTSMSSIRSVLGMPFQFKSETDARIDGTYGRMYAENIIFGAPIATIIVGSPRFLSGKNVTKKDRGELAKILLDVGTAPEQTISDAISKLIDGKNARYYSFMTQHSAYMKYVNTLCSLFSQYCGVGDMTYLNGKKYKNFDYRNENMETDAGSFIETLFGSTECVNVYFNPQSSLQESNSNNTQQSKLAGMVNNASDTVREAQFVLGTQSGKAFGNAGNTEQQIQDISKLANNANPSVIGRLIGNTHEGFNTVISGANLLFPDIYSSSNFSRSYQLDITLSSPYANAESVFLNVLRPLAYLVSMGLPRQFGANGTTAPFIIQAHSKGLN